MWLNVMIFVDVLVLTVISFFAGHQTGWEAAEKFYKEKKE